ncbi:hypothetical protein KZX06_05895 [Micrococcus sp. EYE_162]|uniref:hypothetical protein n=1 Tax=unclassified Micrococcus TaxID=2620948 RepID=UPI0020052A02|nr:MULTISPECIES: hypothetical protein [unclassified Micrococcus]MCK6095493.1 hypothetical protein [Micrococcus sp. EYE_212]MCK6171568.1 hypothetical protein [Micrococcus sp. EYE_162]
MRLLRLDTVRPWQWRIGTRTEDGVGLFYQGRLTGHLSTAEARQLADALHDAADAVETPDPDPYPKEYR